MSNSRRATARNRSETNSKTPASHAGRTPHPLATVTFPAESSSSEPSSPGAGDPAMSSNEDTTTEPSEPKAEDCRQYTLTICSNEDTTTELSNPKAEKGHQDTLTFAPDGVIRSPPHLQAAHFRRRAAILEQLGPPVTGSNSGLFKEVFFDDPGQDEYPAPKRHKISHIQTEDLPEPALYYVENSQFVAAKRRNAIAGQDGSGTGETSDGGHLGSEMLDKHARSAEGI
ncbi:hypothetical protein DL546_002288 [Coniochaeta pulveracea]|uniref:Uncharacterized protein n=1 Tax=Coniochaeta pulveracea TaxID=177199 RepID=A0A420Y7S5_9PEZI|nr:hypothetical protein DL546_002288 [Coniochaeta pulveracea]